MFKSLKRVTYQVTNIEKAKRWYSDLLKLEPSFDSPFYVSFEIGDNGLSLLSTSNPPQKSNEQVVAYWEVEDIDSAYKNLLDLGAIPVTEIRTILNSRVGKVIDPFGNVIGITSKALDSKKMSVENKPSESAMTVAFCRALAASDESKNLKGPDYLAEIFLSEDSKRPLKDPASREWIINKMVTPGLYLYFHARTVYIDNIFIQALLENIPQIVFLGAGYDMRTYRFKELIKDTRIFELDIQPTQQRKMELLNQAKILIPEQLSFVTINFKSDKIEDVLFSAGYNKNKKTFFIWEGVVYYLSSEAVNETLKFVKKNSQVGSTIFFDYMTELLKSPYASEPFQFSIEEGKIEMFLSQHGYKIIEHFSAGDIEKKFLTLQDGSLVGSVMNNFCFVFASV